MPQLRILILSDGRPGHFNLAEGIAAAAARGLKAEITRINVRRGRWPGAALAAMTTGHLPAAAMLRRVYGIRASDLPPTDLIVSAGAETLAANIWVSRILAVPNIFYGSLRLYDPHDFALVLTSYARKANRPRHALALKPARIDPGEDIATRTAFWPPRYAALVLGGDAGQIRYQRTDWDRLLDFAALMHREHGTRWLVANSRRTPDEMSERLLATSREATAAIAEFLDVRTAGPGTLIPLLQKSDVVFCTADSSSMLSECVWMRLPVIALSPQQYRLPLDEAHYRQWLEAQHWTAKLQLANLTSASARTAATGLIPLRTNPQVQLARLVRQSIPSLPRPS